MLTRNRVALPPVLDVQWVHHQLHTLGIVDRSPFMTRVYIYSAGDNQWRRPPSVEHLATKMLYLLGLPEVQLVPIVLHLMLHLRFPVTLANLHAVVAYVALERALPSLTQLMTYLTLEEAFLRDGDEYEAQHRQVVPASSYATLASGRCAEAGQYCAVCQEEIRIDAQMIILCCGCRFHYTGSECLGDSGETAPAGPNDTPTTQETTTTTTTTSTNNNNGTVRKWLSTHNTCPACRAAV
jgi:hypothetical protein